MTTLWSWFGNANVSGAGGFVSPGCGRRPGVFLVFTRPNFWQSIFRMDYEAVIGLETHVQLKTKSKMWCGCANQYGAEPNTNVCPVCLGLPGVLPVPNEEALRLTVLTGFLLNCEIPRFNRKPVSTVRRSASSLGTGNTPGRPRQTGQTLVFGSAPY